MADKRNFKILFFFPYHHTGGAERIHAQMVECLNNSRNIVVFTDRSRDKRFKKNFFKNAKCFNFFGIQNKIVIINKILVFVVAILINRYKKLIVVGSNSLFFYQLLPKLNRDIKVIDIVHSVYGPTEKFVIKNVVRVDRRIIITPSLRAILEKRYGKEGIDKKYLDRISVIENRVQVPGLMNKKYDGDLNILFIGRDSREKRPALAVKIYNNLANVSGLKFIFIGRGLKKYFNSSDRRLEIFENVNMDKELSKIYENSHIIFLTSILEGFPLVFMEAMSYGVVPISTPVGGISDHLQNGYNSILIGEKEEDQIVTKFVKKIKILDKDRDMLAGLSLNSYNYAKNNFGGNDFCRNYNCIINEFKK